MKTPSAQENVLTDAEIDDITADLTGLFVELRRTRVMLAASEAQRVQMQQLLLQQLFDAMALGIFAPSGADRDKIVALMNNLSAALAEIPKEAV